MSYGHAFPGQMAFRQFMGSFSHVASNETVSVQIGPPSGDPDQMVFTDRLLTQYGLGWLLDEENGTIPGETDVESDVKMVLIAAVLLTIARVVFQRLFAKWWLGQKIGNSHELYKDEDEEDIQSRAEKASESAWKFLFYFPAWLCCLFSVYSRPWWTNMRLMFVGWPYLPVSPLYKFFFLGELAFYIHSTVAHFTIEVRRADFTQMAIHHVVTSFLVGGAYFTNYMRIGGVLLLILDMGDVTLELGKVLLYAGWEKVSTVMIGCLIVIWWGFRVYLYAAKVMWAGYVDSVSVCGAENMAHYEIFSLCLFILWALNAWWGYLITRIALRKVMGKGLEDTREKRARKKKN